MERGPELVPGFWEKRKHLDYYRIAWDMVSRYQIGRDCVLEVGPHDCPLIAETDFTRKVTVDCAPLPPLAGVRRIEAFWPDEGFYLAMEEIGITQGYDATVCLQTIEHQKDAARFCRALIDVVLPGTGLIVVSVPHKWPDPRKPPKPLGHHHHEIDLEKLDNWMELGDQTMRFDHREAGGRRLVAAYRRKNA